jgi:hypothetical protein
MKKYKQINIKAEDWQDIRKLGVDLGLPNPSISDVIIYCVGRVKSEIDADKPVKPILALRAE